MSNPSCMARPLHRDELNQGLYIQVSDVAPVFIGTKYIVNSRDLRY